MPRKGYKMTEEHKKALRRGRELGRKNRNAHRVFTAPPDVVKETVNASNVT